jgi:hypothetical protein
MGQYIVCHHHMALGGEGKFGDGTVADAQVQFNGSFGVVPKI